MDIPADPNQVKDIVARIRAVQAKNNPKGLPKSRENVNETDADFPTLKNQPRDNGWRGADMITGNGGGPKIGDVGPI